MTTRSNLKLAGFDPMLGAWTTRGRHPYLLGRTLRGRVTFERIEDGAFIRMRSVSEDPEIPSGVAIFGTDDAEAAGSMLYFDDRGVSRRYSFALRDGGLTWSRDDPAFRQRFTITVELGGSRLAGQGEMSREGAPWERDLELEYARADGGAAP